MNGLMELKKMEISRKKRYSSLHVYAQGHGKESVVSIQYWAYHYEPTFINLEIDEAKQLLECLQEALANAEKRYQQTNDDE